MIVGIRISGIILSLLQFTYLVRTQPEESLSNILFIVALVNLTAIFSRFGMDNAIVRSLTKSLALNRYFTLDFSIKLAKFSSGIGGLFSAGFLFTVILVIQPSLASQFTYILLFSPLLISLTTINTEVRKSFGKRKEYIFTSNLLHPIVFICLYAILNKNIEIQNIFLLTYVIQFLVTSYLVTLIKITKYTRRIKFRHCLAFVKRAKHLFFANFINRGLLVYGPILFLGVTNQKSEIITWAILQRTINLIAVSIGSINNLASIDISRYYNRRKRKGLRLLLKKQRIITAQWCFAFCLPILLLHRPIYELVFTLTTAVYIPLIILCLAQIVSASCGPVGYLCIMTNRTYAYLLSTMLGALVFIASSSLTVATYGITGAALSLGLSQIVINYSAFIQTRQYFK
jgi:O-antigen/teichoic acid export membrane protein